MGPSLKSLLMLLTASALCSGERKSEKRDISEFGSGFSTSKLEGSGIKISTDFGKEITLEEYKRNGYSFVNDGNTQDDSKDFNFPLKDNNGNYDFTKDLENEQQILANLQNNNGIPSHIQNIQNLAGVQGINQHQGAHINQVINENQLAALNAAVQNQGRNNGDSSSVSYITQNIPVPVPQPYQVNVNTPVPVPIPHPVPISVPKPVEVPVPQPYPVQINKPYPVYVNRPVPVNIPHPVLVPQRQEFQVPVPQPYPVQVAQQYSVSSVMSVTNDNQDQTSTEQETSQGEDKNTENSLQNDSYNSALSSANHGSLENQQQALPSQNANQVFTHESETTFNNGFVPSSFQGNFKGQGLFTPQQSASNNRQQIQSPDSQPTHIEFLKNLQNLQNQAILSNQAQHQAALTGLSKHQEAALSGLAQNLHSVEQSVLSQHNQRFNVPVSQYQQNPHGVQSSEPHATLLNARQMSFLPNQGHQMNLQQNLYQTGNIGHSFAPNLQQNSQTFQHQYPASNEAQSASHLQSAASQAQAGGYNVAGGHENNQRPDNIQQILLHGAHNAKM